MTLKVKYLLFSDFVMLITGALFFPVAKSVQMMRIIVLQSLKQKITFAKSKNINQNEIPTQILLF